MTKKVLNYHTMNTYKAVDSVQIFAKICVCVRLDCCVMPKNNGTIFFCPPFSHFIVYRAVPIVLDLLFYLIFVYRARRMYVRVERSRY